MDVTFMIQLLVLVVLVRIEILLGTQTCLKQQFLYKTNTQVVHGNGIKSQIKGELATKKKSICF